MGEITNKQIGHTSQFAYDGLSRRISDAETDSGNTPVTTHYLWCGTYICEARDSSDNLLARYYAQGELHGSTIAYYAQDQVGSVVATVDPQGQITSRLKYDSYGNIIQSSGALPDYRYAGLFYHTATGLSLATWRAYDPKIGRWLSRDPIRELGGTNLYGYVGNDPLNWVDLSGLERKPGKTPNKRWPKPPTSVCGKNPKWNPDGYWEGKGNRDLTWDDRSHGTGVDRGSGPQGGHWDDENSNNRWDENGNPLPGSPDYNKSNKALPDSPQTVPSPPWWIIPLLPIVTIIFG
ncbi:MAG: RHS repeat-associated core domain-containing protein [Halothiobacillus sp.]|jgi:RHS repeat-associated protein|nr:RHS repeat-associated core domain-containing protein [Halothiobacillus sp.]